MLKMLMVSVLFTNQNYQLTYKKHVKLVKEKLFGKLKKLSGLLKLVITIFNSVLMLTMVLLVGLMTKLNILDFTIINGVMTGQTLDLLQDFP